MRCVHAAPSSSDRVQGLRVLSRKEIKMRLIRNVYGEPSPLIMHPRLGLIRSAHMTIRFAVQSVLRRPRTLPAYWRTHKTREQRQAIVEACEIFVGARGSEPAEALKYRMQAIEELLAHPAVSEEEKKELRVALSQLSENQLITQTSKTSGPAGHKELEHDGEMVGSNRTEPVSSDPSNKPVGQPPTALAH